MLKPNMHYFKISIDNKEKLEERYMFLNWHKHIDKYIKTTKKLKELLATIKTLKSKGQDAKDYYKDLYELILEEFASKSELNCFINACDFSIGTLKKYPEVFESIVNLYLKHRDFTDITPKEWIQAIIDKGASRGKSKIGEKKLIETAEPLGFIRVRNWTNFQKSKKAIASFSKNVFDIAKIKENLGIDLEFENQNKMLDVIIKNKDKYIFIEAKHLKEGGGSQNEQLNNAIEVIKYRTKQNNIFCGAFVDGDYSNALLEIPKDFIRNPHKLPDTKNKLTAQQKDIIKTLKDNSTSFWFNTAGFKEFIKDFAV